MNSQWKMIYIVVVLQLKPVPMHLFNKILVASTVQLFSIEMLVISIKPPDYDKIQGFVSNESAGVPANARPNYYARREKNISRPFQRIFDTPGNAMRTFSAARSRKQRILFPRTDIASPSNISVPRIDKQSFLVAPWHAIVESRARGSARPRRVNLLRGPGKGNARKGGQGEEKKTDPLSGSLRKTTRRTRSTEI